MNKPAPDDLRARIELVRAAVTRSNAAIAGARSAHRRTRLTSGRIPLLVESGDFNADALGSLTFATDLDCPHFREIARLTIPRLMHLLDAPAERRTDLMLNLRSSQFARDPALCYDVRIAIDGHTIEDRVFQGWHGQHQFLIPLHKFASEQVELEISASSRVPVTEDAPVFQVEVFACERGAIHQRLEEGAIWLFSTARSGSTWLAADILCSKERARLLDEPGIGRMFAPIQWDAERFFDASADWRSCYVESGFEYETGTKPREFLDRFPMFERAFTNMGQENQILRDLNFGYYHRTLRDVCLGHIINEWGCRDYSRVVLKCPNEGHAADFIMRAFPRSHMVFLMRDGRDVMRSRFSPFASPLLAHTESRAMRRYAIAFYSHWWNFQVDIMRSAYDKHDPSRRYFVKYEDLRNNTAPGIAALFNHLSLPISPDELTHLVTSTALEALPTSERAPHKPRQTGAVGGYRSAFSEEEIELMNKIMSPNLALYGYHVKQ